MHQSVYLQCRCCSQPDAFADQYAHTACDMQRNGIQLHTDERDSRNKLCLDTCDCGRYNTGWADIRERTILMRHLPIQPAAPLTVRYIYTLTANGCTNPVTFNVDVVVNPMPSLTSTLTPPAICSGTAFSYTPTSGTAGTSFGWTRATCGRYHTCWTDIRDRQS